MDEPLQDSSDKESSEDYASEDDALQNSDDDDSYKKSLKKSQDLDFNSLDPELYGLRRSGRAAASQVRLVSNAQSFADDDDGDSSSVSVKKPKKLKSRSRAFFLSHEIGSDQWIHSSRETLSHSSSDYGQKSRKKKKRIQHQVQDDNDDEQDYEGDVRFSNRSRDVISYYDKEVDDALGSMTDTDEEQRRKKRATLALDMESQDEITIDSVWDHRLKQGVCLFKKNGSPALQTMKIQTKWNTSSNGREDRIDTILGKHWQNAGISRASGAWKIMCERWLKKTRIGIILLLQQMKSNSLKSIWTCSGVLFKIIKK